MVAVFIVLWIISIVTTGVVLISAVQLIVLSARKSVPYSVPTLVLGLFLMLFNISLLVLLVTFTQEMLTKVD